MTRANPICHPSLKIPKHMEFSTDFSIVSFGLSQAQCVDHRRSQILSIFISFLLVVTLYSGSIFKASMKIPPSSKFCFVLLYIAMHIYASYNENFLFVNAFFLCMHLQN